MDKKKILEEIEKIQPYIDSLIEKNYVKFLNPTVDYQLIEQIYYSITNRKWQKFNSSCGSCLRESLLIINNWKNRELKLMAIAEAEAKEPEIIKTETVVLSKKTTPTKKPTTKIKPKSNGRK